jgi:hypothetical protein
MRSWPLVAAFALVLAAMPVVAQRGGGGHASGGHGGGFSSHASMGGGHFGGMHSGSGMSRGFSAPRRSFSGQSLSGRSPLSRSFSGQSFAHQPSFTGRGNSINGFRGSSLRAGNRFRGSGFRNFGFRNRGWGYPWSYPWGYGFYDPDWWWNSDSGLSHDQDYYDDRAYADQMNQQSLEEQQMRRQGDQDVYARSSSPQTQSADPMPAEVIPATVLIYRDQRKEEIHNYAIVGQTLWNFSPQRTEKIPLSDLDIAATSKVNQDRGVDFHLPDAPEGQ